MQGPFVFHDIYLGFNQDIFDDVYMVGRKEPDPCCTNNLKSCREELPKCGKCSPCARNSMNGNQGRNCGQQNSQNQYGGMNSGARTCGGGGAGGQYSPYAPATGSFIGGLPKKPPPRGSPCACSNFGGGSGNECQGQERAGTGYGPCCPTKRKFNPKEIYVGFNETVYQQYGTSDCRCC